MSEERGAEVFPERVRTLLVVALCVAALADLQLAQVLRRYIMPTFVSLAEGMNSPHWMRAWVTIAYLVGWTPLAPIALAFWTSGKNRMLGLFFALLGLLWTFLGYLVAFAAIEGAIWVPNVIYMWRQHP